MKTTSAIIIMSLTVFIIRFLPFLIIGKEIKNSFIKSFLYYVPFITLSVMTFPSIVTASENKIAGVVALLVGCISAYITENLFTVAVLCSLSSLIVTYFMR